MIYSFRCPDCGDKFKLELRSLDDQPDYCPHCGVYVGLDDPDFVPSQLNIGTHKGKAVDLTYRQMEESSIARAEAAGDPSLKITNMNDNLRAGDVAGKKINNIVTHVSEQMGHSYYQGSVGTEIGMAKGAGLPGSGARALQVIQGGGRPAATPTPAPGFWGAKQ